MLKFWPNHVEKKRKKEAMRKVAKKLKKKEARVFM
jgi:hypothetical protein